MLGGIGKPYVKSLDSRTDLPPPPPGIGKPYVKSLDTQSDLPPDSTPPCPLVGQTGVIKIAALFLLPYISFIIAFTALEWILYMVRLYSQSGLPPNPSRGSNWGHKIAELLFLPYISFKPIFLTDYNIY